MIFLNSYFHFYKKSNNNWVVISEQWEVTLTDFGDYSVELYNNSPDGSECSTAKEFTLVTAVPPLITNVFENDDGFLKSLEVEVSGNGIYEYALNLSGPYQLSNVFENVSEDVSAVYVRDINGCGQDSYDLIDSFSFSGIPTYFSPNGDGINDYWQFPKDINVVLNGTIDIYDRFGKKIASINQYTKGWDGNFRGQPLPSTDYWFRAMDLNGRLITGHFSLLR